MLKFRKPAPSGCVTVVAGMLAVLACAARADAQPWDLACGDGRVDVVIHDFESLEPPWLVSKADPSIPDPSVSIAPGCHGNALQVPYDLSGVAPDGRSWITLSRDLSGLDLTPFTHLRLALRGTNLNSHEDIEIRLTDTSSTFAVTLHSMTDLPVWRPIYIDFRELTGDGTLDLANITRMAITVARCDGAACEYPDVPGSTQPPAEHAGTVYFDELAAVDLKPGGRSRLVFSAFEGPDVRGLREGGVRQRAVFALMAHIQSSGPGAGWSPTWYGQASPEFSTAVQAELLLVLVYELGRVARIDPSRFGLFRDAAVLLARKLLDEQIAPGRIHSGAWFTSYTVEDGVLMPPTRSLPEAGALRCDGNETLELRAGALVADNIDACEWVGNVGWILIALSRLERAAVFPAAERDRLRTAITRGADWIAGQSTFRNMSAAGYPDLISYTTEGNMSAFFGLLAASRTAMPAPPVPYAEHASRLAAATFQFAWDPLQHRLKPGVRTSDAATALNVSGGLGVMFLRASGRTQEALESAAYTWSVARTVSFDGTIRGFADEAGPVTPSTAGSLQAVSAGMHDAWSVSYDILRGLADSDDSNAFRGAPEHWFGGATPSWTTTMTGSSPTAWAYLAVHLDPLYSFLPFDDDPLIPGMTPIRWSHVEELRARVDRVRDAAGLPRVQWPDLRPVLGPQAVLAAHLQQVRDALRLVYIETGRTPPLYSTADLLGAPIRAVDIAELRLAIAGGVVGGQAVGVE